MLDLRDFVWVHHLSTSRLQNEFRNAYLSPSLSIPRIRFAIGALIDFFVQIASAPPPAFLTNFSNITYSSHTDPPHRNPRGLTSYSRRLSKWRDQAQSPQLLVRPPGGPHILLLVFTGVDGMDPFQHVPLHKLRNPMLVQTAAIFRFMCCGMR